MKRISPRFLFSDPQNTKSKGPFVIHTLDPVFIVKVSRCPNYKDHDEPRSTNNGKYILFFVDQNIEYSEKLEEATEAMFKWIESQERLGTITIPNQ